MEEIRQCPIVVLGAGSWGTALALHLARIGEPVRLWSVEADHIAEMIKDRVNKRYLPTFPFPDNLHPIADLANAMQDVKDVLIAVPSVGFHDTLVLLKPFITAKHRLVSATKGLDPKTGQLLHEVAEEVLGSNYAYAALSGPSFATEVAAGLPTAVMIASQNENFAKDLYRRFNHLTFRVYLSKDIIGVEVGGVVKNVLAIATGISDGMGFGANARCALITRGLAEMMRLGKALGAESDTFMGLSGMGDLILTCTDNQSRNRRFGLALGQGKNPDQIKKEIGQVVEGEHNAELVMNLAKKLQVEMPIVEAVWLILHGKLSPKEAMVNLMSRETKHR